VFSFYEEHNISDLDFNIEEIERRHGLSSLVDFDERAFIHFFERFCALMKERRFAIAARERDETLASIRYLRKQPLVNNPTVPFGIVTLGVDGESALILLRHKPAADPIGA
jgi:hypothetical protein